MVSWYNLFGCFWPAKHPPHAESGISYVSGIRPSSQGVHSRRGVGEPSRKIIYFSSEQEPYRSFTNTSEYQVWYNNLPYRTGEHLFQAMKFLETRPDVAEHIRHEHDLDEAIRQATKYQYHITPSWEEHQIDRMEEVLHLKFTRHVILAQELLATGDAELIQYSPADTFWGSGTNNDGRNELGKALMRLRESLRETAPHSSNVREGGL